MEQTLANAAQEKRGSTIAFVLLCRMIEDVVSSQIDVGSPLRNG